jgi:orotate phosphoribosyltransferase
MESDLVYTPEQRDLLLDLFHSGAILLGDAVRERFGLRSPIYINMRGPLYDNPDLLWRVGREYARKICDLALDKTIPQCVVGIPDTATPLALATALYSIQNQTRPAITYALLRKDSKTYPGHAPTYWIGTRDTSREYNLIDDVVASGKTKRDAARKMQGDGLNIARVIVLVDREQGDGLRQEGYDLHGVLRITEVLNFYRAEKLISPDQHQTIVDFLAQHRFDAETPLSK